MRIDDDTSLLSIAEAEQEQTLQEWKAKSRAEKTKFLDKATSTLRKKHEAGQGTRMYTNVY